MTHGAATLHRAAYPRYPFRCYRLYLVEICGDSRNIGTGTTIDDSEGATDFLRSSPSLGYHTHEKGWLGIGKVGIFVTNPAFPSIRDFKGGVFLLALTLTFALFTLFLSIFVKMGLIFVAGTAFCGKVALFATFETLEILFVYPEHRGHSLYGFRRSFRALIGLLSLRRFDGRFPLSLDDLVNARRRKPREILILERSKDIFDRARGCGPAFLGIFGGTRLV